MKILTPAQVHAIQIKTHAFIVDPSDARMECLICNAFVADLVDVWQTELDNIRWFAFHDKSAIIEEQN